MIETVELKTCKGCHEGSEFLSEQGLCKKCIENNLIPMRCVDCGHAWKNPGPGSWCPSCGGVRVTSDDEVIDTWILQKEAEQNGVSFIGMQKGYNIIPDHPLFQDSETGSFTLEAGENIAEALARKRREFKKQ